MSYEQWLAALCIWREARGCSLPAKTAVWNVIQNRANDPKGRWPKNVAEVVLQPKQFSSFNANDPNVTKFPNPKNGDDWLAWLDCETVVSTPIGGDNTEGAVFYESLPEGMNKPEWAKEENKTLEISGIRFYKG